MTITRAQAVFGGALVAAALLLAYFSGAGTRPPVEVTAVINEDGTLHHVTLRQDGMRVGVDSLETIWIDQDGVPA